MGRPLTSGFFVMGRMVADQDAVVPTVIVAFELQELGAPCDGARQAQGKLDNLGTAVRNQTKSAQGIADTSFSETSISRSCCAP